MLGLNAELSTGPVPNLHLNKGLTPIGRPYTAEHGWQITPPAWQLTCLAVATAMAGDRAGWCDELHYLCPKT
jgi:hypothetical protein